MPIRYNNQFPKIEDFFALFETTGWDLNDPANPEEIYSALKHSWYSLSAYHDSRLIGYGRVISDGFYHAFIVELIIHPDYQGQRIGSHILTQLVAHCQATGIRQIQLFSAKGKAGFYEKHGFQIRSSDAPGMEIKTTNGQ
jgi:ribosomal protein S18 acetylase RimI-like enzyme